MPDDPKPSNRGRRRRRTTPEAEAPKENRAETAPSSPVAPPAEPEAEVEVTAEPRLTGRYKAKTCIKYASSRNGKTVSAVPGDLVDDLSPADVKRFRKSGAIVPQMKG